MRSVTLAVGLMGLIIPSAAQQDVSFEEKVLSKVPAGLYPTDIVFSPDGRQVAYKVTKDGRAHMVVNNELGPSYETVDPPAVFSPDGKKVAYRVTRSGTKSIVLNGRALQPSQLVGMPVFSADSSLLAYDASDGGMNCYVVVGDKRGDAFHAAGPPIFAPKGSSLGYAARVMLPGEGTRAVGTRGIMVVNGKRGPLYDRVDGPDWSPDGKKYAYRVWDVGSREWSVVYNERKEGSYEGIDAVQFSPNSARLAYLAKHEGKDFLIVDGKKVGTEYDYFSFVTFTPDGKKVVYGGRKGRKAAVVVDGKPLDEYDGVGKPVFSADGKVFAYPAQRSGQWMVIHDAKIGATFETVDRLAITPDGAHIAYVGHLRANWWVMGDDVRNGPFNEVGDLFLTKAGHAVYRLKRGQVWSVRAGNNESPAFDQVFEPIRTNADGTKVGFGARRGSDLLWKVLDVR